MYFTTDYWFDLCAQAGSSNTKPTFVWFKIREPYLESWRKYHDFNHIEEMLEEFDREPSIADSPLAVRLAIIMHDHQLRRQDPEHSDEFLSARKAWEIYRHLLHFNEGVCDKVDRIILAPADPQANSRDQAVVLDLDLMRLGAPPEQFAEFGTMIREEFKDVPDERFNHGRARILQAFYEREPLYQTAHFRDRFEAQAKTNLAAAIAELTTTNP